MGDNTVGSGEAARDHSTPHREEGEVWDSLAGDYAAAWLDSGRLLPVHEAMLAELLPALERHMSKRTGSDWDAASAASGGNPCAAVLDVASGGGEPALLLAQRAPAVSVAATDSSPSTVSAARKRVSRRHLGNIQCAVADGQHLDGLPDGALDAVLCCHGLMFMPDWRAALREWCRALRPGGVLVLAVWGARREFDYARVTDALAERMGVHVDVSEAEDPCAFGDSAQLAALLDELAAAGFRGARTRTLNCPFRFASAAAAWGTPTSCPVRARLDELHEQGDRDILERAEEVYCQILQDFGFVEENSTVTFRRQVCHIVTASRADDSREGSSMARTSSCGAMPVAGGVLPRAVAT